MNIIRILNLNRAFFIESKKRLLICSLTTFGVVTMGFSISAMPEILPFFSYFVLFFLVALGNSNLIKNYSTHFNTLPASTSEKFTHAIFSIIIVGIMLQVFSLLGAWVGHYLILPLLRSEINTHGYSFWDLNFMFSKAYFVYFSFLSVFLFGTIYFKKNVFLKTLGTGIGFLFGISVYFLTLAYFTFKSIRNVNFEGDLININLTDHSFFQNYWYIFPVFLILFFLSLTYLRLRETEV